MTHVQLWWRLVVAELKAWQLCQKPACGGEALRYGAGRERRRGEILGGSNASPWLYPVIKGLLLRKGYFKAKQVLIMGRKTVLGGLSCLTLHDWVVGVGSKFSQNTLPRGKTVVARYLHLRDAEKF